MAETNVKSLQNFWKWVKAYNIYLLYLVQSLAEATRILGRNSETMTTQNDLTNLKTKNTYQTKYKGIKI